MPDGMGIGQGISGISDVVGLFTSLAQQSQQNAAMQQTGNYLQNDLGQLTGEGSALYGNYAANAEPAENQIIANAPGQAAAYQGSAAGGYGAEGGYGSMLGASPYPGMVSAESQQFMNYPNASIGQQTQAANTLENWQGIQPKELGEATTVASNAAESAAQTMKSQMGGVANPGAVMQQLGNQATQAGMQTGLGLGSMAEQQELGAREAAAQQYGQIAGEQLGQVSGEVGAQEAAGGLYQGAMEGAGGLEGAAAQGYAGLSEQQLQELESALSGEQSMAQTGIGAQYGAANDWESLLGAEMGQVAQEGNPYTSFGTNLASLFGGGGFGGQYGGGYPPQGGAPTSPYFGHW